MTYNQIPLTLIEGIEEYVMKGAPQGGFLTAVFRHDLFLAVGKADLHSQRVLVPLVTLIFNHCPARCHGKERQVDDWIARGGLLFVHATNVDSDAHEQAAEEWRHRFREAVAAG